MPAVKIADLILLYLPLKYINSAIKPVTIEKGIGIQVIPVINIKIPIIVLIMRIMPGFFTLVRNNINGIPPIIPIMDDNRTRKIGMRPVIAKTITITK